MKYLLLSRVSFEEALIKCSAKLLDEHFRGDICKNVTDRSFRISQSTMNWIKSFGKHKLEWGREVANTIIKKLPGTNRPEDCRDSDCVGELVEMAQLLIARGRIKINRQCIVILHHDDIVLSEVRKQVKVSTFNFTRGPAGFKAA